MNESSNLLVIVITGLLSGGLISALLNYLRDRRSQRFVEQQQVSRSPLEVEGLRLTNADQALAMMQKVNESLVERITALEKEATEREKKIAGLEVQIDGVRRSILSLVGRCEHITDDIINSLLEI